MRWKVQIALPALNLVNHRRVGLNTPLSYTFTADKMEEDGQEVIKNWRFSAVVDSGNEVGAVKYALAICGGLLIHFAESSLTAEMEGEGKTVELTGFYDDHRKVVGPAQVLEMDWEDVEEEEESDDEGIPDSDGCEI